MQNRQAAHGRRPPSGSWIRLHDVVAWLYLYPVRGLSRLFPVSTLVWLARCLAPGYARLRRDQTVPISRHMARAFEGHELPAPPDRLAESFVARDLRRAVDDLVLPRLSPAALRGRATVKGLQSLDRALGRGRGVIVVSGHFHANRLAKSHLRHLGYPMLSIRSRIPRSGAMGRFGNRFVAPAYGRMLHELVGDEIHTQDAGLGAGLLRRLRENGIVNVHIDAVFSRQEKFRVRCLNEQRRFAGGFVRLAALTGAPIVPMLCLGDSGGFEIQFGAPLPDAEPGAQGSIRHRLQLLAGLLESWVLAHPEEWLFWSRERVSNERPGP